MNKPLRTPDPTHLRFLHTSVSGFSVVRHVLVFPFAYPQTPATNNQKHTVSLKAMKAGPCFFLLRPVNREIITQVFIYKTSDEG